MANPTVQLGILSKLYYNTATYGSPTWAAITLIGDLTIPQKWDVAEILIRASRLKFKSKTALDVSITGKLLASLTDTGYLALMTAMLDDSVVDFLALNGPNSTNGVRGYRFDGQVIGAGEDQGPGNVVWDDLEIQPALTANTPKSALVASGAPVFTAI